MHYFWGKHPWKYGFPVGNFSKRHQQNSGISVSNIIVKVQFQTSRFNIVHNCSNETPLLWSTWFILLFFSKWRLQLVLWAKLQCFKHHNFSLRKAHNFSRRRFVKAPWSIFNNGEWCSIIFTILQTFLQSIDSVWKPGWMELSCSVVTLDAFVHSFAFQFDFGVLKADPRC